MRSKVRWSDVYSRTQRHQLTASILLIFLAGRLLQYVGNPRSIVGGDTPMYMPPDDARWRLVSFWGHSSRSWFVTFPFALFETPFRITLFQHTLSALSGVLLLFALLDLFKSSIAKFIIGSASLLLLLRADIVYFNSLLMSESIQISLLSVLVGLLTLSATRPRTRLVILPICAFPVFALCTIRIAYLCLYLPIIVMLVGVLRNSRRNRVKVGAVGLFCVLLIAMTFQIDGNINKKWGLDFAGNDSLNGRTMQQVSLLGATQIGQDYLTKRIKSLTIEKDCIEAGFRQGEYWPGFAIRCPRGVEQLTDGYEIGYLLSLIRQPLKAIGQHLPATYAAFAPLETDLEWKQVAPMPVHHLTSLSDGPSTASPLLAALVAGFMLTILVVSRSRRSDESIVIATLGLSLVGVFILSLVYSPIDTYRVCIAATLGICLVFWATISLWIEALRFSKLFSSAGSNDLD